MKSGGRREGEESLSMWHKRELELELELELGAGTGTGRLLVGLSLDREETPWTFSSGMMDGPISLTPQGLGTKVDECK
jgi:hypothetical protein